MPSSPHMPIGLFDLPQTQLGSYYGQFSRHADSAIDWGGEEVVPVTADTRYEERLTKKAGNLKRAGIPIWEFVLIAQRADHVFDSGMVTVGVL